MPSRSLDSWPLKPAAGAAPLPPTSFEHFEQPCSIEQGFLGWAEPPTSFSGGVACAHGSSPTWNLACLQFNCPLSRLESFCKVNHIFLVTPAWSPAPKGERREMGSFCYDLFLGKETIWSNCSSCGLFAPGCARAALSSSRKPILHFLRLHKQLQIGLSGNIPETGGCCRRRYDAALKVQDNPQIFARGVHCPTITTDLAPNAYFSEWS